MSESTNSPSEQCNENTKIFDCKQMTIPSTTQESIQVIKTVLQANSPCE